MSLIRNCLFIAAISVALPSFATTTPVYLSFSGGGANGNVNGVSFSNANWSVEYAINTNVVDSDLANTSQSVYYDAVMGGHLSINSTVYSLVGDSAKGIVSMYADGSQASLAVNMLGGGYMSWSTASATTFPALFANVNELNSAHLGATIFNSTADPYNNDSALDGRARQNEHYNDATGELTYTYDPVVTVDGGSVVILAIAPAGAGLWRAHVDSNSVFAPVPEPESYALLLAGLGMIGLLRRRRA